MTWAQCLKQVFNIDIETCRACGGAVKIIACIEDPVVIEKILNHLDKQDPDPSVDASPMPPCRAQPQGSLFDWDFYHASTYTGCNLQARSRVALGLQSGKDENRHRPKNPFPVLEAQSSLIPHRGYVDRCPTTWGYSRQSGKRALMLPILFSPGGAKTLVSSSLRLGAV